MEVRSYSTAEIPNKFIYKPTEHSLYPLRN